jgi:hypothetical protein
VQKANIIKTIRLYGEVKREIDNFAQISVPKPVELACAIGSIINNASDISGNNTENNFAVGRVAEIEENATEHIVKIDLASNYVVVLTIADSYSTYIGDIVSGELNVEIQNNYRLLNVDFLRLDYDKTTTRFLFFYRLTQLDNYTFPNMGISAKIIEKEYKNAVCLDISALRNLTEDYKAVVDRVVSTDNNVLRLEELQFEIIDVANDKIIIDAGSYLGSSFLVYDIYHAVPIK